MSTHLYRIKFDHVAPKDHKEGTETFALADDEATIFERVDKEYNYDSWSEDDDEHVIYDDDYQEIGTETRRERVMRLRGQIGDEDNDYSDAYYGITDWGWDEGVEISDEDAATLLRLGLAMDWRTQP